MYGTGVNAPKGLQVSSCQTSSTFNSQQNTYPIVSAYATSLFKGDPVAWDTNGKLKICTASNGALGVFQGCSYLDTTGTQRYLPYWAANTVTSTGEDAVAFVVDDERVLFDIQVSTSAAGPVAAPSLTQTDMGKNASFAVADGGGFNPIGDVTPAANPGTGSTRTGLSGYYLDASTIAATATLSLKLWKFTPVTGNIAGVVFNNALVSINNSINKGGTGTAGHG